MANTINSFPIDFDLYDADEQQVLFITNDVLGQELTLEITNTSYKPFSPKSLDGAASATNHHFELVFRPGTLYNNPAAVKLDSSQFELFMNKGGDGKIQPNADGSLSLFFKSKEAWTLREGEKLLIKLSRMRAEGTDGTRGTRVMLKYRNLIMASGILHNVVAPQAAPFTGFREMHLNIVNHRGKRNIPLNVGFVGSNTVLNNNDNANPNSLKLRITNYSKQDLVLDAAANSKLTLALEAGPPSDEWTLATVDQVNAIGIKYKRPGDVNQLDATGSNGVWEIPFVKLGKGQFIDVEISNLITDHPTGHANLYLHYENIPGFWDGEVAVVIEKSPFTLVNKNMGIGTSSPNAKLEVNGPTRLKDLSLEANIDLNKNSVFSVNYYPWWTAHNKKFIEFKSDFHDNARGQVHFYAPSNYYTNKPVITLAGNYGEGGKVGVGIEDPQALLDVNGEIRSKKYQFLADNKWQGQSIDKPGEHVVQFIKRNDPYNIFDDPNNRFVAPTSGYYFFSTNLTFGRGNDVGDGVIVGIFKNADVMDNNTTIIVISPGLFKTETAQSVTSMMDLKQGDTVDVRLQGVDNSRFSITYCSFMGVMVTK